MDKTKPNVVNFMLHSSEKIIESKEVQQISHGGEHRPTFLVITEYNIHIFSNESDTLESLANHPHRDLVQIDTIDEVTFRLTYKKENPYTFISDDLTQIIDTIYSTVTTVLLPDKYPQISANGVNLSVNHDLYFCVKQRYKALLAWQLIYPTKFLTQSLERFLKTKPQIIDLGIIEDLGLNVSIFLESAFIQPRISTIVVPTRHTSNYYEILITILQKNTTFKKLIFHEPLSESFIQFFAAIRKLRQLKIESFEFIECVITPTVYHQIEKTLKHHQITFSFVKCDISQCEQEIGTLSQKYENLNGLHLTSIWIESDFICPELFSNLTNLSLRGCRICIEEFLTLFSADLSSIQSVDLSKNTCMNPFSAKLAFPASLQCLYLNDVTWAEDNFLTIFHQACMSKTPLTLSLSEVTFLNKKEGFDNFFKKLENGGPGLQCLYWNCNKISQRFCQFLLKCTNLKFLSFGGCYLKKSLLYSLQKLIESHRSLVILDVHNLSKRSNFGVSKIISWVKKSNTIRRLDLSGNAIGEHCITKLGDCIANNKMLRQVLIDKIECEDYQAFEPLVRALKERTKMIIYVQFPDEFFNKLKNAKIVNDDLINEIKPLFKQPISPENQECHGQWRKLINHEYPESQDIELPKKPADFADLQSNIPNLDSQESNLPDLKMNLFSVPSPQNDSLLQSFESKYDINEMSNLISNSIFAAE